MVLGGWDGVCVGGEGWFFGECGGQIDTSELLLL